MKLILALTISLFSALSTIQAPTVADKTAPSKLTITTKSEPGDPLIVTGVVFGPDGKTSLAGASVYVYHTDATGLYTPGPNNDSRNPRLRGYMRTDAQGRYEYHTIKPAPYRNNDVPAHIHYHVNAPNHKERVFEIMFEGDAKITDKVRAQAAQEDSDISIRSLTRSPDGVWRCTQNVILRK